MGPSTQIDLEPDPGRGISPGQGMQDLKGPGGPLGALGASPQQPPQKAPVAVVTARVAGASGAGQAPPKVPPQKGPQVVVTTGVTQEVKPGGLQAPTVTKTTTPLDLQTQFYMLSRVFMLFLDCFGMYWDGLGMF